jgi:hypothetical protein
MLADLVSSVLGRPFPLIRGRDARRLFIYVYLRRVEAQDLRGAFPLEHVTFLGGFHSSSTVTLNSCRPVGFQLGSRRFGTSRVDGILFKYCFQRPGPFSLERPGRCAAQSCGIQPPQLREDCGLRPVLPAGLSAFLGP